HAIAVANATAGLHLAFLALELGRGDEIIQPALNFVATANMTIAVGATPVFADIVDLSEPTIDPEHVEKLVTPRTKAVVVMHYGGNLGRSVGVREPGRERGLTLNEISRPRRWRPVLRWRRAPASRRDGRQHWRHQRVFVFCE